MAHQFDGDIIAGLSGLELKEAFELGDGVLIRPTYAHLIGAFMVAFSPAPPGKHHPPPWKRAQTGFGADITAELHIPKGTMGLTTNERLDFIQLIVALLRLWVTPSDCELRCIPRGSAEVLGGLELSVATARLALILVAAERMRQVPQLVRGGRDQYRHVRQVDPHV